MIIFLHGAETFRSRRLLQELKNKFSKDIDPGSHSLDSLDGQAAGLAEISERINTGSLFTNKRLIVVENIFKNKKEKIFSELAAYLQKFPADENNIIIFWDGDLGLGGKSLKAEAKKLFAFLSKQKYSQEFPTLTNSQRLAFIRQEAKRYQKTISAPAAALLDSLTGGELWLMATEIKKLSYYSSTDGISEQDIKEMVSGVFSEDIFAFTDALGVKNKALALKLLTEQYEAGLSDEYLIAMLIRQFKILIQIREALDKNTPPSELAFLLKMPPFVAKKGALQARNFSLPNLKKYLDTLISLDFANKTGATDIKTELTILISRL